MFTTLHRTIVITALLLASTLRGQQNAAPPFVYDQIDTHYFYNADGTGRRTQEIRAAILTPAGVQAFGQLVFGYNSETERLAIDYVRVRKPDGQIVTTAVESAKEASLEISKSAPVYSDHLQRHISVAGLSPGDTIEYKTTTTFVSALAPNQFWLSHSFEKRSRVKSEVLVIDVPKNRTIKLKTASSHGSEDAGDRRILRWSNTNETAEAGGRKTGEDPVPDVQLSTFQSWQEVASWYDALLRDRTPYNATANSLC